MTSASAPTPTASSSSFASSLSSTSRASTLDDAPSAARLTPRNWDQLLIACQKGNLETVISLIEDQGVDPNHSNVIRQSALHICAWWARTDCLQYLLAKGANVHAQNTMTGATPLHCSLQSSNAALTKSSRLACIRLLLEQGADPRAVDLSDRTPLEYLEDQDLDRDEIVAIFQEFTALKEERPLIFAAISDKNFERFLSQLLPVNENDQMAGETITSNSMLFQGHTPLLRLVSDWCWNDIDGESTTNHPFYKAAINNLLENSSSMTLICATTKTTTNGDESQETAVDVLCRTIVERYKQQQQQHPGILIDQDPTGLLPDWCAVVDQLVSRFHHHHQQQQKATDETQQQPSPPLYTSTTQMHWIEIARRNWMELAMKFAQSWKISLTSSSPSGSLVFFTNRQGMTPLQFAARSGHLEMVQYLLDHCDAVMDCKNLLTLRDQRGQTALQAAQVNGHDAVVTLLQDYESKLNEAS